MVEIINRVTRYSTLCLFCWTINKITHFAITYLIHLFHFFVFNVAGLLRCTAVFHFLKTLC